MELTLENFTITWEPLELEGKSKIPENLKVHLQKLYKEIKSPKPTTIDKIRRLIKKYPRSVQLKNYLSSTYNALGNTKKAREINDVMLKKHPDYLFAKINKANHYADVEEFEKMTDILGKGFDLKTLYPDREVFHISEFMVMHQTAVRYYLGKDDLDQAQKRIDLMKEVDEDAPQYQQAQEYYSFALMQMVQKRYKEEEKKRITPKNKFHLNTKKFELPEFNFKQTYDLYAYEMDLPDALIDEFLAFDRSKAIEDLENVLKDSYFNFDKNETGESDFAAVHALLLLAEMKAEESLPVVLEMMQQDQDYFDEIFGEIFTEAGWMPLMKLGKNQLGTLADFLKLPGLHTYFRSAVNDVLVQIIHHCPEKKSGVLQVFEEVLNFFTTAKIEDNVIDTELNGFIVWDLTELKLVQFLPQIKQLYEKGYVNPGVCGTYENIAKDIKKPDHFPSKKRKLMDIKELYNDFFVPVEESHGPNYFEEKQTPNVNTKKKIGRNDPCPCGSGKKYKKCCLRKGVFE